MAQPQLRLLISPAQVYRRGADKSVSPSPISALLARNVGWSYESPSGEAYARICSVACLYDFTSQDPGHLSFQKGEVLEVVKQENTGWWAAVRGDGTQVGWIPASYVRTIPDATAAKLYARQEDEVARRSGSRSALPDFESSDDEETDFGTSTTFSVDTEGTEYTDTLDEHSIGTAVTAGSTARDPTSAVFKVDVQQTPNPKTPTQTPPNRPSPSISRPRVDKSLPASPLQFSSPAQWGVRHSRSQSGDLIVPSPRLAQAQDNDRPSLQRLSTLIQTHNLDPSRSIEQARAAAEFEGSAPPSPNEPDSPILARRTPRGQAIDKIKRITGDEDAQKFHDAKIAQANLPWFMRPRHSDEEIKLEYDGTVKAGTLPALVERLVIDPLRMEQQENFRRVFLTTFRTFSNPTEVFELLISHYEMDAPSSLSTAEFEIWKREKLRPTQRRVLTVLSQWLEEHDLLNQSHEIAPRLQEFLSLIVTPPQLQTVAQGILATLKRLTFAEPPSLDPPQLTFPRRWKRKWKGEPDLAKMDPWDMAQHLCLYEHALYRVILRQECFNWTKVREGPTVAHMAAFTTTYDRLADWVKLSILEVDALGKRATIVDFWIRVADKCRAANNFSSLSAIVAALSSTVISRLHFTWLNASRESVLTPLLKFNSPGSNYSYYRSVLDNVASTDAACIPYAGPFLKMMVYAQDQHADNVVVQTDTRRHTLIHFVKRAKWYEASTSFLRFQPRHYTYAEYAPLSEWIVKQLERAASKGGDRYFWARSDEVQKAELVHADIKKGLQAAGF
ncbi:ras GEF [Peniophora sp. CONT]|nr:ras GEF [Peniophora sp. CONT]